MFLHSLSLKIGKCILAYWDVYPQTQLGRRNERRDSYESHHLSEMLVCSAPEALPVAPALESSSHLGDGGMPSHLELVLVLHLQTKV